MRRRKLPLLTIRPSSFWLGDKKISRNKAIKLFNTKRMRVYESYTGKRYIRNPAK